MMQRARRGQSVVEYMLGISVVVIGLAAAFTVFGESVSAIFDNVRITVQQPYP
jgi:hypothetical protein